MYNEDTLKLIKIEEEYPDKANSPTIHKKYECPCGKKTITYSYVPGFNDYWVNVECDDCNKKYEVRMGEGHLFKIVKK